MQTTNMNRPNIHPIGVGLLELPTELLLYMADYLPSQGDLNALIQTNQQLYHMLQACLYHHNVKYHHSVALLWAAARNRADMMQAILAIPGCNPNIRCPSSFQTSLIIAARHGHAEVVRLLLDRSSVDVNAQDDNGDTALAAAASAGYIVIVRLLLRDARVDVNREDWDGRTPLAQAAIAGSTEVVRLLLEEEAIEPDAPDSENWTPLAFAAAGGHIEIVRCLLQLPSRVNANVRDWDGATPLMWAARRGAAAAVELLLSCEDVDVTIRDEEGRTALMWAVETGHQELVPLFDAYAGYKSVRVDEPGDGFCGQQENHCKSLVPQNC